MNIAIKNEGAALCTVSAPNITNKNSYIPIVSNEQKNGNPEATKFLNLIAGKESITFQTFDDKKVLRDVTLTRIFHGSLEQYQNTLTELNENGAGIFFTVNTTDLKGRGTKNILKVRALFIDLDGAPLDPVFSAPLKPNIVIETSPGRFHVYWLVDGVPLENFSLVQKRLIQRFNADPAVHDLPRVMRLPGFFHLKKEPFLVHIHTFSDPAPYQYLDFLEKFEIDGQSFAILEKSQNGSYVDPILQELNKRKMIKRQLPNKVGAWEILCPWRNHHTTGDYGTVYFEANKNGYENPGFKCQHSHCAEKGIKDLKEYLGLGDKNTSIWDDPLPLKEELKPVATFDQKMLPETLRPWIMDNAERMQVPPDFLAAASVVVLGSLIGRKIGVFPKAHDDWLVIPNLWGAIVGRPSLLKSPAIAEIMKPLDELAEKAIKKHLTAQETYKEEERWLEARISAQKDEMKKAAKEKKILQKPSFDRLESIPKPVLKRYKTEDSTVEKIGEILFENPQGILIHRDELVGWLKSLEKNNHEGDRAFFLESWNGNGSYTVDRIGRGTLHIPAICLSIIGGIQPGPLEWYVHQAANGGGGDDGLLQRFQILVWPNSSKTWKNIDRSPDLVAKKKAFDVFQKIDAFVPFEPSLDSDLKTFTLRFSPDAQKIFDDWRNSLEQKLRNGDLEPALESHLAKYRSLMPSLALIFYIVETVGAGQQPMEVNIQATLKAVQWCEYLETHAKRLYASGEDPGMDSARNLLEHIKKGDLSDGFSPRDVYHAKHWSKLENTEQVNNAIKILEEFGWVKVEVRQDIGRPSKKVFVHPGLSKQFIQETFKEG